MALRTAAIKMFRASGLRSLCTSPPPPPPTGGGGGNWFRFLQDKIGSSRGKFSKYTTVVCESCSKAAVLVAIPVSVCVTIGVLYEKGLRGTFEEFKKKQLMIGAEEPITQKQLEMSMEKVLCGIATVVEKINDANSRLAKLEDEISSLKAKISKC